MEIHNLSMHADCDFNSDMKVYIALDAPAFMTNYDFAKWRARVTKYVNEKRLSIDMTSTDKNYSVIYVPEAVTDEQIVDEEPQTDENVLFITKRPDPLDGPQTFAKDLEVPGNHTIIMMHDLGNIIPVHEPPLPDLVSTSARILGWSFALFMGVIAAVQLFRMNPNSLLGM